MTLYTESKSHPEDDLSIKNIYNVKWNQCTFHLEEVPLSQLLESLLQPDDLPCCEHNICNTLTFPCFSLFFYLEIINSHHPIKLIQTLISVFSPVSFNWKRVHTLCFFDFFFSWSPFISAKCLLHLCVSSIILFLNEPGTLRFCC